MTEAKETEGEPGRFEARVDEPRGDVTREWELFVRESAAEPLRHAGSVSAANADAARERAAQLFGWTADAFWLCPADETRRFAADGVALSDRADDESNDAERDGTESNDAERADDESNDDERDGTESSDAGSSDGGARRDLGE